MRPSVRGPLYLQGVTRVLTRDILVEDVIFLDNIVDDFLRVLVEYQDLPLEARYVSIAKPDRAKVGDRGRLHRGNSHRPW